MNRLILLLFILTSCAGPYANKSDLVAFTVSSAVFLIELDVVTTNGANYVSMYNGTTDIIISYDVEINGSIKTVQKSILPYETHSVIDWQGYEGAVNVRLLSVVNY